MKDSNICGPLPMFVLCEIALKKLGVSLWRTHKEVYGLLTYAANEKGWLKKADLNTVYTLIQEMRGHKIKAKTSKPVAVERSDIVTTAVFRSGECTACLTRLISGKVFVPELIHLK